MSENKNTFQPEPDNYLTYEDQQDFKKFVRLYAKFVTLKEEITMKVIDLVCLEEACDEIALFVAHEGVLYSIEELSLCQDLKTTKEELDEEKKQIEQDLNYLKSQYENIEGQLSDLKSELYGKFGNRLNLEAHDFE